MNVERKKYRVSYSLARDPLVLIPITCSALWLSMISSSFMVYVSARAVDFNALQYIGYTTLVFTWATAVYLASININWEDFRAFLKGKGDGDLI